MPKENIVLSYRFDELSEEVQEKTLDRYRDFINMDMDFDCYGFLLDDWKERLESIGFTDAKIYFSGFSSQGDGSVFEASIDNEKLLDSLIMCNSYDTAKQAEKCMFLCAEGFLNFSIQRNSFANHYSHEKTAYIQSEIENGKISDSSYWNGIIDDITEATEELRLDLCRQIYKELENEYDFQTSDAAIRYTFEANEYEFTIDGKIF